MATEVRVKAGTQLVWADTTDFDDDPFAQDYQLDLTSLANAAARQGAKGDFGATRARRYAVFASIEIDVAPASGEVIDLYFAPSPDAAAGDENPGGVSGADAAYIGTAGDSIADSLKQLDFIGSLVCTSDADPVMQIQLIGVYSPPMRYGSPVVFNQCGQAHVGDATHSYLLFQPIMDEIQ